MSPLAFLSRAAPGLSLAMLAFALGIALGAAVGPGLAGNPATASAPPFTAGARTDAAPAWLSRDSHPAEVVRVIDGDTFEARVRAWPGIEITTKVRLRGI